jgi:hypothetical protein
MASEMKVRHDAAMVERLRKEQDESCQSEERLCSERGMGHTERDAANQEHDTAQ